jgi:ABC-type thiamine transport system ATPase subunit
VSEIASLEDDEELLILVSALFRKLIDQEVTEGVRAVERLQTEGLQAVFDDLDLSVKANIEESRGKISVELVTVQKQANGDVHEGLAKDDFGGSVLTVQSVLLRVIIMLRRGLRPLLLLDESLPAFDANYIANMGKFLSELCSRLNIDILMVTHNPALFEAADRSYKIVRKKGESVFVRVR